VHSTVHNCDTLYSTAQFSDMPRLAKKMRENSGSKLEGPRFEA